MENLAHTTSAAAPLTGLHANYMQLAGTNIEDFDRAMRARPPAAKRGDNAPQAVEREVTR